MTALVGHFSAAERDVGAEDTLRLLTVGVDIGSATTHLVFSRLELAREDSRYVVVDRAMVAESDILLTPYSAEETIDGEALESFVVHAYEQAGVRREDVDAGALILTGVALIRHNARAIADVFADEAGRFVSVAAGDNLEALLAARGSGAMQMSAERQEALLHVDVGGGTAKLVLCTNGRPVSVAALDVGARLVVVDGSGRVERLEPAGRAAGEAIGLDLDLGRKVTEADLRALAGFMADHLVAVMRLGVPGPAERALLRTPPLAWEGAIESCTFSGGVAEFLYGREARRFGDLGPYLADAIRTGLEGSGMRLLQPSTGIRATVVGASQYTVQVSGSTIFISPDDAVPLRNVPVVSPDLRLEDGQIDEGTVSEAIGQTLRLADLADGEQPVAVAVRWEGSASYRRIDAFCKGVVRGLRPVLDAGHPLVLAFDGDVGGLFGLHLREMLAIPNPVISVDGLRLEPFDYVDVGALIPTSGAVPVVIKSLLFPTASDSQVPATLDQS